MDPFTIYVVTSWQRIFFFNLCCLQSWWFETWNVTHNFVTTLIFFFLKVKKQIKARLKKLFVSLSAQWMKFFTALLMTAWWQYMKTAWQLPSKLSPRLTTKLSPQIEFQIVPKIVHDIIPKIGRLLLLEVT